MTGWSAVLVIGASAVLTAAAVMIVEVIDTIYIAWKDSRE